MSMLATASCSFPTLERWKSLCARSPVLDFVDCVLSGFAQIAFNDNSYSGLLMIVAVALAYPVQAISGVVCVAAATLVSWLMGVPRGLVRCGLYGFNAALLGLALPVAVFPGQCATAQLLLYSVVGGALTVLLAAALSSFFSAYNVSPLSMAYCVAMLIMVPAGVLLGSLDASRAAPAVAELAGPGAAWGPQEFLVACLAGIAQVLWVETPFVGVLYLVAVALASRVDVLLSVAGALVGTGTAIALGIPKDSVMLGLYGYNAVLLMKVMGRAFKITPASLAVALALAAGTVVVGAGLSVAFAPTGIGSFAAWPYVTLCVLCFLGRSKLPRLTYVPAGNWGVPETIHRGLEEGTLRLE